MWRKLSCLLLCIAMLAGLAGCGKAASDTGKSEGKTVDKVTSTDNAAAADTAAQNKAYGAALWDIYLYGILPDKMALGGDSGGANLALGLNLYLRDTPGGNAFVKALLLYYGAFGMMDSCSFRLYGTLLDGMRRSDLAAYINYYATPEDQENPYYAAFLNDLSFGMPPVYMCCGDLDPLLDNTKTLEAFMKLYNVPTQVDIVPGVLHAFMHYGRMMPEAVECLERSGAFFKAHLDQ